MNLFTEYGLLVAVAIPVGVVVVLQVCLFLAGERGTLLLPSLRPYESIAIEPAAEAVAEAVEEAEPPRTTFAAEVDAESEERSERLAA